MKPYRVAVVDDDSNIRQIVEAYLRKEGYETIGLVSAEQALKVWETAPPDLWVLDVMLPGMNGYEFCRRIRMETETPIIIISARDEEVDKILGLELGGDDYLTKPFSPRELVARVNRALRRWSQMRQSLAHPAAEGAHPTAASASGKDEPGGADVFPLVLNTDTRQVFWQGEELDVTPKEFELLRFLRDHPNRAFARDELLTSVWGYDYYGSDRAVDDLVRRLRKKIPDLPLETVWGYGYRLRLHEEKKPS